MTYDEIYETELLEMVETLHSTASILVESRGVNEDFTQIITVLYAAASVKGHRQHYSNDSNTISYDFISFSKLHVSTNSFITHLNFIITFNDNGHFKEDGGYVLKNSEYNPITDTLDKVTIRYHCKYQNIEEETDNNFRIVMWHEIHHAYRDYCILRENFRKLKSKTIDLEKYATIPSDLKTIKPYYYWTNKNEIDAYCASTYEFVKNKTITYSNYQDYIKLCPGYKPIKNLRKLLNVFTQNSLNERVIQQLMAIREFEKRNNENLNSTLKRVIRRLSYSLTYAEKQFYKTLEKSLEEDDNTILEIINKENK